MKKFSAILKLTAAFALFFVSLSFDASAQRKSAQATPKSVVTTDIRTIVQKYDGTEGVEAVICDNGFGLKIFKMMLRQEFGKDFLKGVNIVMIFEYGKTAPEVTKAILHDFNQIAAKLTELKLDDEPAEAAKPAENADIRGFVTPGTEDGSQTADFLLISDDAETKCVFYFGGLINIEDADF